MRTTILALALALAASPAFADPQAEDVQPESAPTWRGVFYGTAGATVLGAGFTLLSYVELENAEQQICENGGYLPAGQGGVYTGTPPVSCTVRPPAQRSVAAATSGDGQAWATRSWIGVAGTLGFGAIAAVSFYKGFVARDSRSSRAAVTPIVTPTTAGAVLSIAW